MSDNFYIFSNNNTLLNRLLNSIEKEADTSLISMLIDFSCKYGFTGNAVQNFIAFTILNDENPFSLSREMKKSEDDSLKTLVLHDLELFREIFFSNFNLPKELLDFNTAQDGHIIGEYSKSIVQKLAMDLNKSNDTKDFFDIVETAYIKNGVGKYCFHKAFRVDEDGNPIPIRKISNVRLNDLIGLTKQKEELVKNTLAFIEKRAANNCLLYGDAGTGKSTSIKAILNEYHTKGLRIIEVYKHQLKSINDLIGTLKDRNYRFIIYMDDLSFEDFETEYKYLKAVIEGGLEERPQNVLIYATSNRRHLVRESFKDRNDDIHSQDTMQEKLSLFARFGVSIYYGAPDKKEFNEIVLGLKEKYKLNMEDNELLEKANTWEIRHGGRSGRTATQFMDYILGNKIV